MNKVIKLGMGGGGEQLFPKQVEKQGKTKIIKRKPVKVLSKIEPSKNTNPLVL